MLGGTIIGFPRHQLFSFYMGGMGWPFHSYQNVFLSSRSWVMKSTREKEQHRRECFSQAGSFPVLFDRSHLGNIFGRWSGSRRMVFLRQLISLYGTEIWELTGSWSNFWCSPAAAMNGNEKVHPCPFFSLYHLRTAYIFVLFLFSCSWFRSERNGRCWVCLVFLGPE